MNIRRSEFDPRCNLEEGRVLNIGEIMGCRGGQHPTLPSTASSHLVRAFTSPKPSFLYWTSAFIAQMTHM
ncbi:hypothetical protein Hanom_Chr05g00402611 [Helianthus anomalus]